MIKRLSWWIIVLLIAIFSFQPVWAEDPDSIENISSQHYQKYTKCQQEKLRADPQRSQAEIIEECQAENIPTNCNPQGGLGWLICPLINIVASGSDVSYFFVRNLMDIDVDFLKTDSPTFQVWAEIRNIANIGLILFFLFMIFSQITDRGMSNYNIKKTLPKFIMAVFLVNLSFFISQLLVDISNITGTSVTKLIETIEKGAFQSNEGVGVGGVTASVAGTALAILLTVVAFTKLHQMNALLSLIMPLLVTYILAMVATGIMLLVRKAAVIALVAISPIAFLSLIFSRTESFYNKWKQGMTVTLVAFPVIALLFGASGFVSKLITHSSSGLLMHILGLVVSGVPMFVAPSMIRKSVSSLPAVGNMINNTVNRLRSRSQTKFNDSRFMSLAKKRRQQGVDDLLAGKLPSTITPRLSRAFPNSKLLNKMPNGGLSAMTHGVLSRTASGQSILKDIDDRQLATITGLSSQLDEADSEKIMNDAENDRLHDLNINDLSEQSQRAIYSAGLNNNSLKEIAGASLLRQSQLGEISQSGFNKAMSFMEKNGTTTSIRNQLSEQARQSSVAKGRLDMDSHISNLMKNGGVSQATIASTPNNLKDYLRNLGADDIAKINSKSFTKNDDFRIAYQDLYHNDANFAYISNAALNDPNLSAATAKEILKIRSGQP